MIRNRPCYSVRTLPGTPEAAIQVTLFRTTILNLE